MRAGEHFVGASEGVVKSISLKKLTMGEAWRGDIIGDIKGTPWAPIDGVKEQEVSVAIKQDIRTAIDPTISRDIFGLA